MANAVNIRELALDTLLATYQGGFSHMVLGSVLEKYDYLPQSEKSFLKRVVRGTLEREIQIDYSLDSFSKTPVAKMKPLICALLRMSAYQILFMEKTPDRAVCDEAVKLARHRHFESLTGFVNGVLRTLSRQKEGLIYPTLSIRYSMPEWIVAFFLKIYGETVTEIMLKNDLEERPLCLRLDENMEEKVSGELLEEMERCGLQWAVHPYLPYALEVTGVTCITRIPGFQAGLVNVQDIASMLVAEVADVKQGDRVVDVCAAPGSKTVHVAAKLQGSGEVIACDVSEEKLGKIRENVERCGLSNVRLLRRNAKSALSADGLLEEGGADVVLVDAPCSGLGVIGKKPDIKFRLKPESFLELNQLQREILSGALPLLKPGGTLIYSTCTVNPGENEEMAEWLVANFLLQKESLDPYLPSVLHSETTAKGTLQLLPGVHRCDGFFIARFRKLENPFL